MEMAVTPKFTAAGRCGAALLAEKSSVDTSVWSQLRKSDSPSLESQGCSVVPLGALGLY